MGPEASIGEIGKKIGNPHKYRLTVIGDNAASKCYDFLLTAREFDGIREGRYEISGARVVLEQLLRSHVAHTRAAIARERAFKERREVAEPDLSFASARASEVTGPLAQLIEAELPRPIYGGMGVGGDRGPYTYTYLEIRVQKLG